MDGKWKLVGRFWYAAEAWSWFCLHTCYDVFIKDGCDGLRYTSSGNEVLPCVQVKFIAVGFCLNSTQIYFITLFTWVRSELSLVHSELSLVRCFEKCTVYSIWVCKMDWFVHMLTYLLNHLLTCSLTPWSRVLLEKLIFSQLVKKFSAFYGTRMFITTFISARHLPYPEPDQSSPCSPPPFQICPHIYLYCQRSAKGPVLASGWTMCSSTNIKKYKMLYFQITSWLAHIHFSWKLVGRNSKSAVLKLVN